MFSHSNTTLQKSLDIIYHWLTESKLKLNPSKCRVLNIHKNTSISTFDFRINNINLSSTKVFKDLGIFISEKKYLTDAIFRILLILIDWQNLILNI